MALEELYSEGADAAEEILRKAYGYEIRKALNPLHLPDFEKLTKVLSQELHGHVLPVQDAALKKAMNALDADWTEMSPEARKKLLGVAYGYIGTPVVDKVLPKITQTLEYTAKDLVPSTKSNAIKSYDLNIGSSLSLTDERIAKYVVSSQANFIRAKVEGAQGAISVAAAHLVQEGLVQGLGSADIANKLQSALANHVVAGPGYWDIIAMVFANRARTMTQLSAFHEAGITLYRWESVLDEVTSNACRFLHGRTFSVAHAMSRFQEVEDADDPEDVKRIMPFLQTGKTESGEQGIYYKGGKDLDERHFVAHVTQSGVGNKDDTGKYSHEHGDADLAAAGIHAPPIHGRCRSTIIPEEGGESGSQALSEPTPMPAKMTSGQKKAQAIHAVDQWAEKGNVDPSWFLKHSKPDATPYYDHWTFNDEHPTNAGAGMYAPGWGGMEGSFWPTTAQNKKIDLQDTIPTSLVGNEEKIKAFINSPKKLKDAGPIMLVKYGGKHYIFDDPENHEKVVAQLALGNKNPVSKVLDLDDKKLKPTHIAVPHESVPETNLHHVIEPKEPTHPGSTLPMTLKPAKEHVGADVILGQKTGNAEGSNDGGFYTGKDGVKRYVKFYSDPAQAFGEQLANGIYNDLGHQAPVANAFEHDGKVVYASDIVDGVTLGRHGLDASIAKKVMRGFVADVLVGNWDVAGASLDNLMVTPAGEVVRIDNGGSFLMRAQKGRRKDLEVLNQITEWDLLLNPDKNPSYAKIAAAAGIHSAEDMKDLVISEIKKVVDLRNQHGGWENYIEQTAPGFGQRDKDKVIEMLEARTKLLEEKAQILSRPDLADPMQPIIGHLPQKRLPPRGLTLPKAVKSEDDYIETQLNRIANAECKGAVRTFTEPTSSYTHIREYEKSGVDAGGGRYKNLAEQIEEFFQTSQPTPMTVLRGIGPSDNNPAGLTDAQMHAFLHEDVFNFGATTSTTRDPGVAYNFAKVGSREHEGKNRVVFILKQQHAVGIESGCSAIRTENELLMHKSSRFQITARYRAAGERNVLIIEGEQIDEGPKVASNPEGKKTKPRRSRRVPKEG